MVADDGSKLYSMLNEGQPETVEDEIFYDVPVAQPVPPRRKAKVPPPPLQQRRSEL